MNKRIRNAVVVGALVLGSGVAGATVAQATVFTNTSTSVNTLISAKCYHHHSTHATTFRWVTAQKRYVPYTSTHRATSDYNTCHK